ncbi:hypothetical protein [Roseivirga pacifica]|uniref:hypothetical protein n=1 Tax=Roseivirga pacifica TaxID=1267423 RepID=UPI00227BB10C|nr:hypothetical protein [Roseivirga pacifica]
MKRFGEDTKTGGCKIEGISFHHLNTVSIGIGIDEFVTKDSFLIIDTGTGVS